MNESLQSLVSSIYAILQIQITKLNKAEYYYIGKKWVETKKKVKKSKGVGKFAGSENFRSPYEISQATKLARLLLEFFASTIFLH